MIRTVRSLAIALLAVSGSQASAQGAPAFSCTREIGALRPTWTDALGTRWTTREEIIIRPQMAMAERLCREGRQREAAGYIAIVRSWLGLSYGPSLAELPRTQEGQH